MKELDIALNAVKNASFLAGSIQNNISPESAVKKADYSPVTLVDLANQALITHELISAFPHIPVVAEEDTQVFKNNSVLADVVLETLHNKSDCRMELYELFDLIDYGAKSFETEGLFWTLDPIDGTRGFLRGDQYAVALALVKNGKVLLGVLGCPNLTIDDADKRQGALMWAVRGKGSKQKSLEGEKLHPVAVDTVCDAKQARFCESVEKAHASHEIHQKIADNLGIQIAPCRMDSQVKYAALAKGDASIYLRLPRKKGYQEKIWDHAAGAIIVEEAGGKVTDFYGNPLIFSCGKTLKKNHGIVATNGHLHTQVLEAIAQAQ
jgi:3'(2'), 5'-bisphosphate nucleotidase